MKVYFPLIIQTVMGTVMIVLGFGLILSTFNSRGLSAAGTLMYLLSGIAIVCVGSMNLGLVFDRVGRSVIAANTAGLLSFAAALYLGSGRYALAGLILFAVASVCSYFVEGHNDRSRSYPYRLGAERSGQGVHPKPRA